MRLTSAVPRRAVAILALLAVWGPGIAFRPLPALPFYTFHGLGQSQAEEATLSSQQASHNAELYSQHHGANSGLLQDITSHWSSVPHQAHPSDHYNIEHQLSNQHLGQPHHYAEHSNPTFGGHEETDGTLLSIPFTQNQYPTAQQPSPAQFKDFVAHPQAVVGYQGYHSFHDSALEQQGFPVYSYDDYYHHLHQSQHWPEQGVPSNNPNEVELEPFPKVLSSPAPHLQVEQPYPLDSQSYQPQNQPFDDTSAVLASYQQSRIQPGSHSAHPGPASFTHSQPGPGLDTHGSSYPNQPADWPYYHGNAAAEPKKNKQMTMGKSFATFKPGPGYKTRFGTGQEREGVLSRVKNIVLHTPWPDDGQVRNVEEISWLGHTADIALKDYYRAIHNLQRLKFDGQQAKNWDDIAVERLAFKVDNLMVRFKLFRTRAKATPNIPGFELFRVFAKQQSSESLSQGRIYVGDLLVPHYFLPDHKQREKYHRSKGSPTKSNP